MNYSDQIIKLIDEVSKRLQIPFERAMEIAVKQLRYMVIMDWIVIVTCSILSIICFVVIYKLVKAFNQYSIDKLSNWAFVNNYGMDPSNGAIALFICIPIVLVVSIPMIYMNVSELIQIAVNPDYAIIQLITNMIR